MGTLSIGHHSLITGGTFTQVNNNHHVLQSSEDRLQAATAPAALHNSAERFDPPRCHPNTRVAVMDELIDWVIRRGPVGHKSMLWLSGPAGAGKSAIAQSLCEICFANKFLLAAFFFNRSDPSRNNPKRLVATLVSQIYRMIPRRYQQQILDTIRNDPLIFDKAIEAQLKALIVEPLHGLFEVDHFNNYHAPRLIVLDGLDECSTGAVQVNLLAALQAMLGQASIPFIILVASRPEHDIQTYFWSSQLESLIHRLDLDNSYAPQTDIFLFVRDKLAEVHRNHPFKDHIPRNWPSDEDIQAIVWKSSGQFIYAAVVVKYVTSTRHYPPDRLDVILRLRPAKRNLPFAELDALYSYIFSCVEDISLVLQIICVIMLFDAVCSEYDVVLSVQHIETLCGLQQGECFNALCDLQSVLELPLDPTDNISILHKSLPDYLQDPARSLDYHVDTSSEAAVPIVSRCLQLISISELQYDDLYGSFIIANLTLVIENIQRLHRGVMESFSVFDQWNMEIHSDLLWFALALLDQLHALQGTDYEYIYCHHLQQLRKFAFEHPEVFKDQGNMSHWRPEMVVVLILSEKSTTCVSPIVLDFLRVLENPTPNAEGRGLNGIWNLSNDSALRCIYTLVHDSRAEFIAFALEWLPSILQACALSPALYAACLPAKVSTLSHTNKRLRFDLGSKAMQAMVNYRHWYEDKSKGRHLQL